MEAELEVPLMSYLRTGRLQILNLTNTEKIVLQTRAMGGWITLGKKVWNAKLSAVSPFVPFECIW